MEFGKDSLILTRIETLHLSSLKYRNPWKSFKLPDGKKEIIYQKKKASEKQWTFYLQP